jgi:hypothetical protein
MMRTDRCSVAFRPLQQRACSTLVPWGGRADTTDMRRAMLWMFWLAATVVLAMTPLLVFAAGASDDASGSDRAGLGAIGIVIAWPLLILAAYCGRVDRARPSLGRAIGRGTLLTLYAAVVFALAWHGAKGPSFRGDSVWAAYWLGSFAVWGALTGKLLYPRRWLASQP